MANLLSGKSLTQKEAASAVMTALPVMDEVLNFDPESKWIYPPEKDLFAPLLPANWKEDAHVEMRGELLEMDRRGHYITRPFDSKAEFVARSQRVMSFSEASRIHSVKPADLRALSNSIAARFLLKETFDSDEILSGAAAKLASYVPYVTGPYERQQYSAQLLLSKSRAYYSWNSNPFGHRIPLIVSYFVVGRGVAAMFTDPTAQQFWDRFAEFNGFAMRYQGSGKPKITSNKLTMYNTMLSVDGELMFHFTPAGDTLKVSALDTATILEVVTNPWNIEDIFYYHQQYMPQWQLYANENIPSATFTIRQIPADQVLHVTVNTFDNEKRGRSDCMSVYGWMRRAADIANANATAAYMRSCYVWDLAVEGSPTDVSTLANGLKNTPHRPGMAYVHSSTVTRSAVGPAIAGSGVEGDLAGLINLIALGSGIPPAYLLGSMGANRASVLAETEPSGKFFLDRQALNEQMLHEMKYRLFKYLRDEQGLRVRSDECEFIFPSINMYDRMNFLSALGTMEDRQWFAPKRCATLASKEFQVSNYNYDEEYNEAQAALDVKSQADTTRNMQSQQAMMSLTTGGETQPNGQKDTTQAASAGGAGGAKASPGIKFLGASSAKTGKANNTGGVDEGEAARTRKSFAGG